jgi:hypothetical protein
LPILRCQTKTFSARAALDFLQPALFETASKWAREKTRRGDEMLWTIFVILLVLWLLGVVSSYTMGGFIHILLVLAVIALIFQLISGRRTVV